MARGFRGRVTYPQRLHSIAGERYFDWAAYGVDAFSLRAASFLPRGGSALFFFRAVRIVDWNCTVRYCRPPRRLATSASVVALAQPLSGCFVPDDISPAAIAMPPAYRAGPRNAG